MDFPDHSFANRALKGLLQDPLFRDGWAYGTVQQIRDRTRQYKGFYSRTFIAEILQSGLYNFREIDYQLGD